MSARPDLVRRGAVYYWRRRLPRPADKSLGRSHMTISLRTTCPIRAKRLAATLTAQFEELIAMKRSLQNLTHADLDALKQTVHYAVTEAHEHGRALGDHVSQKARNLWARDQDRAITEHRCNLEHSSVPERGLKTARTMFDRLEISYDPEDPVFNRFARRVEEALLHAARTERARTLGEYSESVPPPDVSKCRAINMDDVDALFQNTERGQGQSISTLYPQYAEEKAESNWSPGTYDDALQTCTLFVALVGDYPVPEITSEVAAAFKDKLRQLPAKYAQKKVYKDLSLPDVVEKAREIGETTFLSPKSVNAHLSNMNGFMGWCSNRGVVGESNAGGFNRQRIPVKRTQARSEKKAFSEAEMRTIFLSPLYLGFSGNARWKAGSKIIKDGRYFLPLLSAYNGLRLEEGAQLRVSDVDLHNGEAVMHLRPTADDLDEKTLKNEASVRTVPIHPLIIDAGLLEHVRLRQARGGYLLFPDMEILESDPEKRKRRRYGEPITGWFKHFARQLGVSGTFYSLRHSFTTRLKNCGADGQIVAEILGHTPADMTFGRYYKGADLAVLKRNLVLLEYGFEAELRDAFKKSSATGKHDIEGRNRRSE